MAGTRALRVPLKSLPHIMEAINVDAGLKVATSFHPS